MGEIWTKLWRRINQCLAKVLPDFCPSLANYRFKLIFFGPNLDKKLKPNAECTVTLFTLAAFNSPNPERFTHRLFSSSNLPLKSATTTRMLQQTLKKNPNERKVRTEFLLIIFTFQETAIIPVHMSSAVASFGGFSIYMIFQCYLTHRVTPTITLRTVFYYRVIFTIFSVICFCCCKFRPLHSEFFFFLKRLIAFLMITSSCSL